MDRNGARVTLKTKSSNATFPIPVPDIPRLLKGKPLDMSFTFDNPEARKAFSFHLLAEGMGSSGSATSTWSRRPTRTRGKPQ